jgi:hypothetical protein
MTSLSDRARSRITARRVATEEDRKLALQVVEKVYRREKRWISDAEAEIPLDAGCRTDRSWFLVLAGSRPAGVIRLVYDPSLELPAEYGVTFEPGVDPAALGRRGRFVEIGRFMIAPRYRRHIRIAMKLLRSAIVEVVERGYTHFLTDVFEHDPHSPLGFHTRVLGFERIGSHSTGELTCASRRIILLLDIARAYQRLEQRRNMVWRELGAGMSELMERRLLPIT